MREDVRAMPSFAGYLLAILMGIGAIALWFTALALTVLGMASALSGGTRGWWIPLGLITFGAGFVPAYILLGTRIGARVADRG